MRTGWNRSLSGNLPFRCTFENFSDYLFAALQENWIIQADVMEGLEQVKNSSCQVIIADPPYGNVSVDQDWDTDLDDEAFLEWNVAWAQAALAKLKSAGLMFVFGQLGKREHRWIHLASRL